MNILIDFTQIPIKKVGVGIYALKTFNRLFALASENNYIALVQNDDRDFDGFNDNNIRIVKVSSKFFRFFILRFLLEQFYIPFLILKERVDIVHSLHYSFPLISFNAKCISTIHDLTFFIYPQLHTFVKRHYFRLFISLSTRFCNTLICVSKSTQCDLKSFFPHIKADTVVIPLAMEKRIKNISFDIVKTKYQLDTNYILFIGTLEPRKNIVRLIEAYGKIENQIKQDLVIVGGKGWFYNEIFDTVRRLNLEDRVKFTGFVSEVEKFSILKNSDIFIYPSLYEGFGLPVLEALSLGIPTITSNVSSMPEVAGDAALLINPESLDEIANTVLFLIDHPKVQNELRLKSIEQIKSFSWENTAMKTLNLYC